MKIGGKNIRIFYFSYGAEKVECLQLGKAVGSDLISHCMLKNTASTICKPLQLIFNYSLQTRKFPKITLSKAFDISQNTVHITSRFSNDKQILW
jgi:hypothetical protein